VCLFSSVCHCFPGILRISHIPLLRPAAASGTSFHPKDKNSGLTGFFVVH
jgi:hypothetical protein